MDILTKSRFDFPLFSPDFIILFENLGVEQVDKPLKILAKGKKIGNPLCVCGCRGKCQIIYNCTYLLPSKF